MVQLGRIFPRGLVYSKFNSLEYPSATVLARAIAKEGFTVVAAGLNPHDLRRGIQLAVETVVAHLNSISKKVTDNEIQQVISPV
jgi:chaperonin GroEL (HSP60 family)